MPELHRHRINIRRIVQILSLLLINPYFPGLSSGGIYQGKLKYVCVPVLNCYSCPLAVFACPIGALQSFLAYMKANLSLGLYQSGLYVLGFLGIVGAIFGRATCGWICPFGLLQDWAYKLKTPKFRVPRLLRYVKYAALALTVFILPALLLDEFGCGQVWFCKWICPAGTLEAGIPLVSLNASYREAIGIQFWLKISILIGFLIWMIFSRRPFCQTLCPLGAIFSLFNRISLLRLSIDEEVCIRCDNCYRVCPMDLRIYEDVNDPNCIRCLRCKGVCPVKAVKWGWVNRSEEGYERG